DLLDRAVRSSFNIRERRLVLRCRDHRRRAEGEHPRRDHTRRGGNVVEGVPESGEGTRKIFNDTINLVERGGDVVERTPRPEGRFEALGHPQRPSLRVLPELLSGLEGGLATIFDLAERGGNVVRR